MGCSSSISSIHTLKVATLNYSGILNSPYQFYSQDMYNQEEQLNNIFYDLLPKYFPDFKNDKFKWGLGQIDQKLQKERYSPAYNADVGVQNGKIISEDRFKSLWQDQFNKATIGEALIWTYTEQQKQRAFLFDLILFHSLLIKCYGIKQIIEAKDSSSNNYQQFTKKFFTKSFLNQNDKINLFINSLSDHSIDIAFIQQPTQMLRIYLKSITKYHFQQLQQNQSKSLSMIIINNESFSQIYSFKTQSQQIKAMILKLNWNQDTTLNFVDEFILISGHLSSKSSKNPIQMEEMIQSLKQLHKITKKNIIVGCDVNNYLRTFSNKFNIYPQLSTNYTVTKCRTMMQPQINKANIMVQQCKDHIVTSLNIIKGQTTSISLDNKKSNIQYLPTNTHPYDHFMVICQLSL